MSVNSDMVANPVAKAGSSNSKNVLVKLKKTGNYVYNVDDWERSLRNILSTKGLNIFLEDVSGIQVPEGQSEEAWLNDLCNTYLLNNRVSLARMEKVNSQVPLKMEAMTPLKSEPKTPSPPTESDGTKTGEQAPQSGAFLSKYEENVRKNSMRIAKRSLKNVKKNNEKITLFCNPFTMVEASEVADVNPKATIPIPGDDPNNPFDENLVF